MRTYVFNGLVGRNDFGSGTFWDAARVAVAEFNARYANRATLVTVYVPELNNYGVTFDVAPDGTLTPRR